MTDVQHKIICKGPFEKREKIIDICENCWKLKSIGLQLQMHNTRW